MIFKNIYYRCSPGLWKIGEFDIYKIRFIIVKAANNYFIEITLYPKNNLKKFTGVIDIYSIFLNEWNIKKLISDNIIINAVKHCIEIYQEQALFVFDERGISYEKEIIRGQEVDLN